MNAFDELMKLYKKCLTCEREVEEKYLNKKKRLRCRHCQKEYEEIFPASDEEFYKIFEGQM